MSNAGHIPVLLEETIDALAVKKGGRYVDGTFGCGGHAQEIVRRGGEVLGIDRDDEALAAGRAKGFRVVKGNHANLETIAEAEGWSSVSGILLDLGVSSPQIDENERGFSFQHDGPLDMRMNRAEGVTAADLVNGEDEENLARIFREWGEEPKARSLARAICRVRGERGRRFTRTLEFAEFVAETLGRHGAHHPATRVFQALRMAVNDEVGSLVRALEGGVRLLEPGGRFAVITFESITDRIVKRFFAAHVGRMESLQQGGERWVGEMPACRPVTRKAVMAGARECSLNPRARSAKLRVVERIAER